MLSFHRTSRLKRRRTVRVMTCRITLRRGRSSQTTRSARSASWSRTTPYCHSVTHSARELNSATSASKDSRRVQSGPWYRASISTCSIPSVREIAAERVVFPAPEVPATMIRAGRPLEVSPGPRITPATLAGLAACSRRDAVIDSRGRHPSPWTSMRQVVGIGCGVSSLPMTSWTLWLATRGRDAHLSNHWKGTAS